MQPLNVQLLMDIKRNVDPASGQQLEFILTADLIAALAALDDRSRPWADWRGRGRQISAMALADVLREFGITPTSDGKARGYAVTTMTDAFRRYEPAQSV